MATKYSKKDLVEMVSTDTGIDKKDAQEMLDSTIATITKCLKRGDEVAIVGFGTFATTKRKARNGRNPQTGETIRIKASTAPKFKAGKALKEAVN